MNNNSPKGYETLGRTKFIREK